MTLTVSVKGTTATGTLVNPGPALSRSPGLVPPGTHSFTGSYDPAGSYDLSGQLPGGAIVDLTGTAPGAGRAGEFSILIGDQEFEGGLLPTDAPEPGLVADPAKVGMEPTQKGTLRVFPRSMPEGVIKFRWFIAAPSAYFTTVSSSSIKGQDVWVDSDAMVLQTGANDSGVLKAHVHAYLEKDGVRTFLAGTYVSVELPDIQYLQPTWVKETGQNPKGGPPTLSYFWEFPSVPGAKDYTITSLHPKTGEEVTKHMFTGTQFSNAPSTDVPIWVGVLPHSFPPTIASTNLFGGPPKMNFIRRGTVVRMLICICDESNNIQSRDNTPVTIKVRM